MSGWVADTVQATMYGTVVASAVEGAWAPGVILGPCAVTVTVELLDFWRPDEQGDATAEGARF